MSALFFVHCAATWALVGLIWTIQLVQYPLFAHVGREAFQEYHRRHMVSITVVVAPLILVECGTAGWLLVSGFRHPWFLASLVPLAWTVVSTWLVQVPLHQKLTSGFDAVLHRRLVLTNWFRTVGWTLRGVCVLVLAIQ
jgi:hypothetical protein